MSLGAFARRIRQRARQVEVGVDRLVKKVGLAVDQAVVLATPADTGRARSNWNIGIGRPERGVREPFAPGSKLGIGESQNAQAALAEAQAEIPTRRPGQDIYISNNLDYIEQLNDGSSAQAPAMFVEQAVETGRELVRRSRVIIS